MQPEQFEEAVSSFYQDYLGRVATLMRALTDDQLVEVAAHYEKVTKLQGTAWINAPTARLMARLELARRHMEGRVA